jgi:hypothetical protein
MTFTRSSATRAAVMAVAAASAAIPLAAQANTSLNATQLSVTVAPISVTGTTLGASVNALGSGLTANGVVPTIDAVGALTAGNNMAAAANSSFNLDVTARAADTAPVVTALSSTQGLSNSVFGSQSGTFSSANTTGATLAITGTTATTAPGDGIGTSASASFTSTMGTGIGESTVRKIATSTNNQTTFTAERQGAMFQFGGSGLEAVTAGGLGTTGLGASPTITPVTGGNTQAGVAFTVTAETRTGQAAVAANSSSSTALSIPAYGEVTAAYGGTTAGAITPSNINAMTVLSGGAGTTSSLSLVQSLTVFGP